MSCYEWESGTIKIPARQWREFAQQILVIQSEDFKDKKRLSFNLGDACITLDDERKEVTWDVPENNHAREHARDHTLARAIPRPGQCQVDARKRWRNCGQ